MSNAPADLAGQRVLVTGAAAGIGRAVATAFSAAGATVAVFDREPPGIAYPLSVRGDVADESDVLRLFQSIDASLGGLDAVVQCAGIQVIQPLLETSVEQFDRVIGINARGTFLIGRESIRRMQSQARGCVINIASELAYLGRARYSAYCASKGAVLSMTRAWAREFAPNIRVNAIAPGPIDTQMVSLECMTENEIAEEMRGLPLGRIGQPHEVAATALFLAGSGGSYYTGQCLSPSGGAIML